ncbi:CBS domain-containing protein [Paenibacillus endoradicis]|uniref:CBS domain-containing protein n=1 Tax=Paenibacillus endoradicis TaxID=2972487 RepID=UPI00280B081A|nr:CBS domain-containing protein [Paenibacillus endoradicis]MCR8657537.1 CBS domain-containing protein [Paenibacillus endoradicis]
MDIFEFVKKQSPVTSDQIADFLTVNRATIRSDLAILVMIGYLDAKPKVGYFPGTSIRSPKMELSTLENMKVRDVQGVPIVISMNATVQDAVILFFLENVESLIVTDQRGSLAGMVSRKDLLKVTLGNQSAPTMPVSLVMTRQPKIVTVSPEESVLSAAKKLMQHEVGVLPVVHITTGADGLEIIEPVGGVSKTTMTQVLLNLVTETVAKDDM